MLDNPDIRVAGDVAHPVDAPYARVNKPQRAAQPSSVDHTEAGASAATDFPSFQNAAALAEQKYCELEPVHTYEEALHTRVRDNRIDFYTVGRHEDNTRDAGDEEGRKRNFDFYVMLRDFMGFI